MFFSPTDEKDLAARGLTISEVMSQIYQFTRDTLPVKLDRPCTPGDGLLVLSAAECNRLADLFTRKRVNHSLIKFVPASGAASRMFRHLYNYNPEDVSDLTEEFILNFDRFPFVKELENVMANRGESLAAALQSDDWKKIFSFILEPVGLHYDSQLKGMVIFHKYAHEFRTAFDEHLHEALDYVRGNDGSCALHFTIAPSHLLAVQEFVNSRIKAFHYEQFEIGFSVQSERTDTVALTMANEPLRDEEGHIVFRPSGHGALIHNLQDIEGDVIFIKNIDNVTTASQQTETFFYKRVLAGLLMELREKIFFFLDEIDRGNSQELENALAFIRQWFQPGLSVGVSVDQLQYLAMQLDRPLRICGMVRNEGEPGGGPYWIKMPGGVVSKQIVEKSQVDMHKVSQAKIFAGATHFNPVDIVASIRKRDGNNYDLSKYIDHSSGFVSEKFHQGHVIKALELPGLWNGSMAFWNTVFVEVPVSTFNPVKTVNDLLRPGHQ